MLATLCPYTHAPKEGMANVLLMQYSIKGLMRGAQEEGMNYPNILHGVPKKAANCEAKPTNFQGSFAGRMVTPTTFFGHFSTLDNFENHVKKRMPYPERVEAGDWCLEKWKEPE